MVKCGSATVACFHGWESKTEDGKNNKPVQREREAGGQGRGEGAWSLLFAGGEFADLAGCGHALARGV